MNALRHRTVRLAGAVIFAALLFVPLVESGHSHASHDLARPCAVCVVAHHSPAAATALVAVTAPATHACADVLAPSTAPTRPDHSRQSGRAPPFPSDISSV